MRIEDARLNERADWCAGTCNCITVHQIHSDPEGRLLWSCNGCGSIPRWIGGGAWYLPLRVDARERTRPRGVYRTWNPL